MRFLLTENSWWSQFSEQFFEELFNRIGEFFSTFFQDWFGGNFLYTLGVLLWNWALEMIGLVASYTPEQFSTEAWTYTTTTVLDFTMAIGASLLNLFYMVGIIRQQSNLKDGFTMETFVDSIIKVLLGNMLIVNGLDLMRMLFEIASISSGAFLLDMPLSFEQMDQDAGKVLFNFIFGIIFFAVSLVCAFTIFFTLYSRYLYLYQLIAVYPLAFSTMPGGHGVSNTASSWTRTFISKTFEIVMIAISVSIASKMCNSIDFMSFGSSNGLGSYFDGALQTIQSMATMIILTGSVKGTDMFMRRAFGL